MTMILIYRLNYSSMLVITCLLLQKINFDHYQQKQQEKRAVLSPSRPLLGQPSLEQMLIGLAKSKSSQLPHTANEFLNDFINYYDVPLVLSGDDDQRQRIQTTSEKINLKTSNLEDTTVPHVDNHQYLFKNDKVNVSITAMERRKPLSISDFSQNETRIPQQSRTTTKQKRRIPVLSLADIQPSADCEPELQTVRLIPSTFSRVGSTFGPILTNQDLYFPHCIRLPRCGGCCPSQRLACVPKQTIWHNISIMHLQYSVGERKFRYCGLRHLRVERHHQCGCECIQKADDCRHGQIYRPDECRCVCSLQDRIECLHNSYLDRQQQQKFLVWNETECKCQCIAPTLTLSSNWKKTCSNGTRFNYVSCRCEPIQKYNLNHKINSWDPKVYQQQQQQRLLVMKKHDKSGKSFFQMFSPSSRITIKKDRNSRP